VNKIVITIEPIEGLIKTSSLDFRQTEFRWEIRWPNGGQYAGPASTYESAVTEVTARLSSNNPYS
jgi:hypothetical protein